MYFLPLRAEVQLEMEKLVIDPEKEAKRIENFISREVKRLGREGVIIGLSGGLDSSTLAFLAKNALGKEKILGLILPERDSNPKNIEDAKLVAKTLGLKAKEINLTPFFEKMEVYKLSLEKMGGKRNLVERLIKGLGKFSRKPSLFALGFPFFFTSKGNSKIGKRISQKHLKEAAAFTVAKTRLRMTFLYYYGALHNFLLLGTIDKSEWSIGFYDGDAICEVQPLIHLYKTQIRQLASFLGIPKRILEKPSSGDLFGKGLPNEMVIGFSYELLDSILYGIEKGLSEREIIDLTGATKEGTQAVSQLVAQDKIRKALPSSLAEKL